MNNSPYSRFDGGNLILRDELAIDRTLLANERTLLAYLRAGAALLIAGGTIMHFVNSGWFWFVGLLCLPIGGVAVIIGVVRYLRMNRAIAAVRRKSAAAPPANPES
jgi:putative membrane protein